MNKLFQTTALLLAAMASGYVGGLMSQTDRPAEAQVGAPAVSEVVRTKRLEVVDANEVTRGMFSMLPGDGKELAIILFDEKGKTRGMFSMLPDGSPYLSLYDAEGETRGVFSLSKDGSPALTLADAEGKPRGSLSMLDGSLDLNLYNAKGQTLRVLNFIWERNF